MTRKASNQPKTLMIMAAGTGGHIFPGLAIADLMRARGWQVSWLGTETGMEADLVARHGLPIDKLNFSGMRGKGWRHTLGGGLKLIGSFFRCFSLIGQRRPDVVLGMGGYVTVPGGVMAALRGVPLVLMNADAGLLLSNKMLQPLASRLLFGLPEHGSVASGKQIVSGNPIRQQICQLPAPQQRYAGRTGKLRILVVGGSLGARVLNDTLPKALALLAPEQRPQVTHQSGKQHIDQLRKNYQAAGVDAKVVDFIDDMAASYGSADLVICRAGAITVSELTAAGVASVLIPFVASSTSHQRQNAIWMDAEQAAVHLPQAQLQPERLAELIQQTDRQRCLQMANAAYALGQRQASEKIAGILEELA